MKKTLIALAVLAVALISSPSFAATILIDDFRDANHFPLAESQQGWGIPLFTQVNPFIMEHTQQVGTILGSERDVEIRVTTTPKGVAAFGVIGDVDEEDSGTEGEFDFGSSSTARVMATLEYDGLDAGEVAAGSLTNALGLGGVDFTAGGNNMFLLMFRTVDPAPNKTGIGLRIEVTSAGGSATWTGTVPESADPFDFTVPFAAFDAQAPLSAATSIRFIFNGNGTPDTAVDFNLKSIAAVPEPASLAMACMGIVVVGGAAWRRRRK
ncbi:MAG: PEP-CTERM sorting domain-containing protein [Pirellulales bacterium]